MLTSPQDTNGFKFSTYYISTNLKLSIQNLRIQRKTC